MERIAIIFEAADEDLECPSEAFSDEYVASLSVPFFFPVLANLTQFSCGEKFRVNRPAPVKRMYCFLRTHGLDYSKRKELLHSLKRHGYDLIMFDSYPPSLLHSINSRMNALEPKRVQPYHRYMNRHKKYAWFPDCLTPRSILPAVLKLSSGKILRDSNGLPRVFREGLGQCEADDVVAEVLGPEIDRYTDTFRKAPLWFEQYINIAIEKGVSVEWRAYYYLGRLFYLCPKECIPEGAGISEPPRKIVEADPDWGMFCSVDYALDTNGRWWILSRREGSFSPLPAGGDPTTFLQNLASEIDCGYDYPDWAWCVVGTIVQQHCIGERRVKVLGSKHFPAGQKVYVVNAYFGLGAERCTVIGKPKYSDRYVCVDMETDLIENFSVERVADDVILRAIYTGRLYEKFERDDTHTWSCWGNEDKDLENAKKFAETSNRYYRKTWTEKAKQRDDGEHKGI